MHWQIHQLLVTYEELEKQFNCIPSRRKIFMAATGAGTVPATYVGKNRADYILDKGM